jgi:hypothetical protein
MICSTSFILIKQLVVKIVNKKYESSEVLLLFDAESSKLLREYLHHLFVRHVRLLGFLVLELDELREPFDLLRDGRHHHLAVFVLLVQEQLDVPFADGATDVLDLLALRVRLVLGLAVGALVRVLVLDDVVVADVDFWKLWEGRVGFCRPCFPRGAVAVFAMEDLQEAINERIQRKQRKLTQVAAWHISWIKVHLRRSADVRTFSLSSN